jgi:hypothetical protein
MSWKAAVGDISCAFVDRFLESRYEHSSTENMTL